MGKKRQHHEEHVDETWLIPYADMLTLLLALFIVMFAISKIDQEKLAKISQQFNVIFSGEKSIQNTGGSSTNQFIETGQSTDKPDESAGKTEQYTMNEIKKTLDAKIKQDGYDGKVKVEISKDGLGISIQEAVLFNSGDAEVLTHIHPLLISISEMIENLDNNIRIAGHTDNVPIHNSKFRSNWDLSAMRAINVMNFMVKSGGINITKVSIQAYSEYQPKSTNLTKEGRDQNRRVEIFIVRKYPLSTNIK
ncbi:MULTISPECIES: flagellar motor protein MotB [Clostridium]|uniref:Motility protein B n=1 Tax=Clostridium ragsdalei P11 TaxID=1353534 RepID=A0A1A6AI07_9CLOT|nr:MULTISPECIES: flagellar motor protein MotB [Clostridium]OBR89681.1 motility protein B [Clostridium ragsdalei P11]QXE21054.1 chemotaxis protein MotB [Clostridium sp. 001]